MNDGGPAFPNALQENSNGAPIQWPTTGMTLRDYFAAACMRGLIDQTEWNPEKVATESYIFADAMLEERDK